MPSTGSDKASFTNLDTGEVVSVQFNPATYTLSDDAQWRDQGNKDKPGLSYERGSPATLQMELWFDTTRGGDNVNEVWVDKMRALLAQSVDGDVGGRSTQHPPFLQFSWGGFELVCVMERLQIQYELFKPDGTPVRAKCTVQLKEHQGDAPTPSPLDGTTTTTVGPGQTLSQVADANGADVGDVARANGIDDPMNVPAGTEVVVPGSPAMADAMAAGSLSDVPTSVSDVGGGDPFSDGFSDVMEGVEAMEETIHEAQSEADDAINTAQKGAQDAMKTAGKVDDARDAAEATVEHAETAAKQVENTKNQVAKDLKQER